MVGRDLLPWITGNWELKLLSLVAAVILWFLVVSGEKAEVTLSAPLEFASIPPGLELAGEGPRSVDVQVQGLRSALGRLSGEDLRVDVSLAGVGAGESAFRLLPEHVRAPKGVRVLRVSPSRVRLVLEPSIRSERR